MEMPLVKQYDCRHESCYTTKAYLCRWNKLFPLETVLCYPFFPPIRSCLNAERGKGENILLVTLNLPSVIWNLIVWHMQNNPYKIRFCLNGVFWHFILHKWNNAIVFLKTYFFSFGLLNVALWCWSIRFQKSCRLGEKQKPLQRRSKGWVEFFQAEILYSHWNFIWNKSRQFPFHKCRTTKQESNIKQHTLLLIPPQQ